MKLIIALAFLLFRSNAVFAQTIPNDSLYLGQTPPGTTPKVFKLPVAENSFVAERIAISNDGRNIFYQELDGYTELDGKPHTGRSKYISYTDGKWSGPKILFEEFSGPAFSITGDTLYLQGKSWQAYYTVKNGNGWSVPKKFTTKLKYSHYLQVTKKGNYYASSNPANTLGGLDRCRINIQGSDTTVTSMGKPINTDKHDFDFFIARDESYIIIANENALSICYRKKDGSWTNPKNLGNLINFGLASWGPYVTDDNKYLFYTTGTKADYSDTGIYWVNIAGIIADNPNE